MALSLFINTLSVSAAEDFSTTAEQAEASVLRKYTMSVEDTQGVNNWYYCEFGDYQRLDMVNCGGLVWRGVDEFPVITSTYANPGANSDAVYMFVSQSNGVVRLRGTVKLIGINAALGDGVYASVSLNSLKLWEKLVIASADGEYDVTVSVQRGDELYFRLNANGTYYNDATSWTPTVEYINMDYEPLQEDYAYYEKDASGITMLDYDTDKNSYTSLSGTAYIDGGTVRIRDGITLGRRYTVLEDGRFRVYGTVENPSSSRGLAEFEYGGTLKGATEYALIFPESSKSEFGNSVLQKYTYFTTEERYNDVLLSKCDYNDGNAKVWVNYPEGYSVADIITESDAEYGKALMVKKTLSSDSDEVIWLNGLEPPQNEVSSISFDIKTLRDDLQVCLHFMDSVNPDGVTPIGVAFGKTGYIAADRSTWPLENWTTYEVAEGNWAYKHLVGQYKKDDWVNIKIQYDKADSTAKVFVNGVEKAQLDSESMNGFSGFGKVRFWVSKNMGDAGNDLVLIDNVKTECVDTAATVKSVKYTTESAVIGPFGETDGVIQSIDVCFNDAVLQSSLTEENVRLLFNGTAAEYTGTYDESTYVYTITPTDIPENETKVGIEVSGVLTESGVTAAAYSGYAVCGSGEPDSEREISTILTLDEDDGKFKVQFSKEPTSYSFLEGAVLKCTNGGEEIPLLADSVSNDVILTVLKNGEAVWEQMIPEGEKQTVDLRIFSETGDTIDLELYAPSIEETGRYIDAVWNYDITKYLGTMFCSADTSAGFEYETESEETLASFFNTDGVSYYSVKNDVKYPMVYNEEEQKWVSSIPNDCGYFSVSMAYPGNGSDSVMEIPVTKDGILKIGGSLDVKDVSDGVVSKIYLNDKLLWSSRVGGERPVRWDEPYDVSYFSWNTDVLSPVKSGDKLIFLFDQWRKIGNDSVSLKGVTLSYVSGELLSETTGWKLGKVTQINTLKKYLYRDGEKHCIDIINNEGIIYIAVSELYKIFGEGRETLRPTVIFDGKEYVILEDAALDEGINFVRTGENSAVVYDNLSMFIGYSELSEISAAAETEEYNGCKEIAIIDAEGTAVSHFTQGETYYIKVVFENTSENSQDFQIAIGSYGSENLFLTSEKITVEAGECLILDNTSENALSFTAGQDTKMLKAFLWNDILGMRPYCGYAKAILN